MVVIDVFINQSLPFALLVEVIDRVHESIDQLIIVMVNLVLTHIEQYKTTAIEYKQEYHSRYILSYSNDF